MKDKGNQKGKGVKAESPDVKGPAVAAKVETKPTTLSAKEKIAANQKNKRRK